MRSYLHPILLCIASISLATSSLAQTPSAGTAKAIPRTPDGKPDLSGIWKTVRSRVEAVQPTPWGLERWNYNKQPKAEWGRKELDPIMHCYRPGLARIGPPLLVPHSSIRVRFEGESVPFPDGPSQFDVIEIRYAPRKIWMIYQYNQESRQIFMDGRQHPEDVEEDLLTRWWNGHSVGRWDGDTLAVDTANIRNETWLNNLGYEHRNLRLEERIRRVDAETLEIERTFTDPIALARPYKTFATLKLTPDYTFTENVICDQYYVRKVGFGFGGLLGINAHPWQLPEENPNATWEDVERREAEELEKE
jgi:hypothetical protein